MILDKSIHGMDPDFDAVQNTRLKYTKGLYYGRPNGFWCRKGWNILINISRSQNFKISGVNNITSLTPTQGLVLKTENKSSAGPAAKPQCQDELKRGVGFISAYMFKRGSLLVGDMNLSSF